MHFLFYFIIISVDKKKYQELNYNKNPLLKKIRNLFVFFNVYLFMDINVIRNLVL